MNTPMDRQMTPEGLEAMAYEHAARFEAEGDPRDLAIFKLAMRLRTALELAEWATANRDEWIEWAKTGNTSTDGGKS